MKFVSSPVDSQPIRITSGFGGRDAPTVGASTEHQGVDIAAFLGAPIYSVAAGRVSAIINNDKCGLGFSIDHGGGNVTSYCHLSKQLVKNGSALKTKNMLRQEFYLPSCFIRTWYFLGLWAQHSSCGVGIIATIGSLYAALSCGRLCAICHGSFILSAI